jgi:hypothetical protein
VVGVERGKLDKLTAALEEAGYEIAELDEKRFNNGLERAEDVLLRIAPAKPKKKA